jgi:aldehyde dehydrogenase (NAD+)/aldehyde dehydrogenase (NAD(P)+)
MFGSMDISAIITHALFAYKNIDAWVKTEKPPFNLTLAPFSPKIYKEPKGVVLIISPFNYPIWCLGPIARHIITLFFYLISDVNPW